MSPEIQDGPVLPIKRIALIIITVLVGIVMGQSLINSWSEPQVASRLQLYQSDLLLQSSSWSGQELPADQRQTIREGLLGQNPVESALEQYQKVRESAVKSLEQLQPHSTAEPLNEGKPMPRNRLAQEQQTLLHELDLRIGLLQAQQGETDTAIQTWQRVSESDTANAPKLGAAHDLIRLWRDATVPLQAEIHFQQALEGWFRYRALEKLYQLSGDEQQLAAMLAEEQTQARSQIVKLAAVATLPGIGAILGVLLLVALLLQRLTQPDAILARNAGAGWDIPWGGETIWQVLVVGFFFVGQILLPLLLGLIGVNFSGLTSRARALYSLIYYVLMASGGIAILYWSIRNYRPLPAGLFQFKVRGSWILWGLGGYLVALPLMLGVALINQQIWQGQGGSNPLLQTVLQEQDPISLLIFLFTAAVAAPLFEELLFRGFLLPSLTKYMPVWGAILLSSLIFASAHLSLSEVLPLMVLGSILGFVYTRSRNLLAPMLLHSAWNSATMVGLFILGSS